MRFKSHKMSDTTSTAEGWFDARSIYRLLTGQITCAMCKPAFQLIIKVRCHMCTTSADWISVMGFSYCSSGML